MPATDIRAHARIHIATTIGIMTAEGNVDARLRDLSKGGARFVSPRPVGEPGRSIGLSMPSLGGDTILATGEIIRAQSGADGHTVAVRFQTLEPSMRKLLEELIEVLLTASGGGQRKEPRIARRLDLRYGPLGELRGILKDISRGGLAMTVDDPMTVGDEIEITVPDTKGAQLLILRARVVHQQPSQHGASGWRVGLEFLPMRVESQRCLDGLLKTVLELLDDVTDGDR